MHIVNVVVRKISRLRAIARIHANTFSLLRDRTWLNVIIGNAFAPVYAQTSAKYFTRVAFKAQTLELPKMLTRFVMPLCWVSILSETLLHAQPPIYIV